MVSLFKKTNGKAGPLDPILVKQMGDPLYWEDRKNDLGFYISTLKSSPTDKYKTLKDGLRLIVEERRAVNADETIPAPTRKLAETHLLVMASMMTRQIIQLQQVHPELRAVTEKPSHTVLRATIDALTPVAKYVGATTKKIAAHLWAKFKPWAAEKINEATYQVRSDVGEVRDEIQKSIRDTASELKYAFRDATQPWLLASFMAAGVAGVGIAIYTDAPNNKTDSTLAKGFTPVTYTYTDIKPIQVEPSAPPIADLQPLNIKLSKADKKKQLPITEDGLTAIQIAAKSGISPHYSAALLCIESRCGDPNAYNQSSKASGMFQFIPSTARQYGLKDSFDTKESTYAFVDFTKDNRGILISGLKREPKKGELYLAHQQGAGGALALLANPEKSALSVLTTVYAKEFKSEERAESIAKSAIKGNGGHLKMTAGEFASLWITKYEEKERKTAPKIAPILSYQ